jgi:EAL domain-containing protein (putative c-di-GMP-specific phosphodiesterase class I)/predicted  nucleic acid-binding Zn-ribbon protein
VKAIETVSDEIQPPSDAGAAPDAPALTGWLLEGRFFTIDPAGAITSWSPFAAEAFGWRRQDVVGESFAEMLLAPHARPADGMPPAGYLGGVDALDSAERPLRAEFALVPIKLSVGYEFNSLLQEISARSTDPDALSEMKARHDEVLALIEGALSGNGADGDQNAGALVVFRTGAAAEQAGSDVADNVVSIADAAGLEEARSQLERARRDAEEGRVAVRSLEGQLEEARREAQRSRSEADVARQESADARDMLIVAEREAEEARRQLEDARRATDEVRAAAEGARIRSEEAQREADSLRAQLREARESVRGMAGRADDELAQAQERAAHLERELADARAEVARHAAEVDPLRERYLQAQREVGTLRADLESARAAATERETVGERRAGELDRLRTELDSAQSQIEQLREQLAERGEETIVVDADVLPPAAPEQEATPAGVSEDAVRQALEQQLFQLHCQPVLDLRTNSVSQYELLIRMSSDDGRLLLPEAFLGAARSAGLAHAIDRWVVRQAIGMLERTEEVSLEVNLSPEAVHDPELAAMVDEQLSTSPVDPARLVFEVTGGTAADHIEETRELAKRLRGLGCRFALDDFRSNFGSFRLLRDLPLDYLKLDGELVGSLAESRTSQLIVKALVDVAAGTGMKTVAVFVSDDETLQMLRQLGVGYAQGYAVGRPRPAGEVLPVGTRQLPPG